MIIQNMTIKTKEKFIYVNSLNTHSKRYRKYTGTNFTLMIFTDLLLGGLRINLIEKFLIKIVDNILIDFKFFA